MPVTLTISRKLDDLQVKWRDVPFKDVLVCGAALWFVRDGFVMREMRYG